MPAPLRFGNDTGKNILVADFLDEVRVELPVLGDHARITLAQAWNESELESYLPETHVIILFHDIAHLGETTFARADRLKAVVRAGVGYNNVNIEAAGKRGILTCNVPDYGSEEVADHAIMMLLALARQLAASDRSIRDGQWDFKVAEATPRLRGKTLGIVGCGRIGTATVLRAKAFGLDVVFYDPYLPDGIDKALGIRRAWTLDEMLPQCQFLSLHCYLDEASHHLIDERALAALPRGAYVVNTARGPVIKQDALVAALESGHIAGAGIDVFEREPFDDERLRKMPNVFLTPHSAFYSREGFDELRRKTAEEALRIVLGHPPRNIVNYKYLQNPRTAISPPHARGL
ncbi:MAG: C-terminal binding protein [bacterium]